MILNILFGVAISLLTAVAAILFGILFCLVYNLFGTIGIVLLVAIIGGGVIMGLVLYIKERYF